MNCVQATNFYNFFAIRYSVRSSNFYFAFSFCIDIVIFRYIKKLKTHEFISCFSMHRPLLSITSNYTDWNVVNYINDRTYCSRTTVYTFIVNTYRFWKPIYFLHSTKMLSLTQSSYLRTLPNDNCAKSIEVDILLYSLNSLSAKHIPVLMCVHAVQILSLFFVQDLKMS